MALIKMKKASPEFIEGELCLMRVIAKDKIEFLRLGFALAHFLLRLSLSGDGENLTLRWA